MKLECYMCYSTENVQLYIIEMIPGSPGVIRPICKRCAEKQL